MANPIRVEKFSFLGQGFIDDYGAVICYALIKDSPTSASRSACLKFTPPADLSVRQRGRLEELEWNSAYEVFPDYDGIRATVRGKSFVVQKSVKQIPGLTGMQSLYEYGITGGVDLDVDSDNDNGFALPKRGEREESSEDYSPDAEGVLPTVEPSGVTPVIGKMIQPNLGDDDGDGIPNYADGIGLVGDTAPNGGKFVPMVVEMPSFISSTGEGRGPGKSPLSGMKVEFTYDLSDPAQVAAPVAPATEFTKPAGCFRVWTTDGSQARDKTGTPDASVSAKGLLVKPGVQYSLEDLGFSVGSDVKKTLYIECVTAPETLAKRRISVRLVSVGDTALTRFRDSALLLPVELKDIKGDGDADDQVIESMQPVPTQNQGESNQAFWQRRNAYFQQQVPDRSIAYIEPHRAANNSPDMPRLVARLPGGPAGVKMKWRLEVEYLRGNGYRASYVEDFTRPEDKVLIPAAGQGGNPSFTAEMDANQEWRIFESQDWLNEIQQRGFFGGTGKLYLWPAGQQDAPTEPIITFRIGGKNPDQQLARTFIDQSAGAQFWYAYAIARHETFGRVRVNGQIRFYNEFYTEYQGGPIGDASVDMGWAAWAKGWPLYNLDRDRRRDGTRYQNGPGGYGMYQLTWGPKHPNDAQGTGANAFIPRRMIWNWQDNANGAITELQGKVGAAEALRNGLQAAYPQWPALPNEGHLSGLESIIVTFYNGTAGLPSRRINGANRRTPWTAEMAGQTRTWQFHQNSQNYVQSVNARINNTMP